jgi:4-carboxymuconolactone decarboxylase
LKKISPDFAEYLSRLHLDKSTHGRFSIRKLKELIAIASLISLGDGKSHLRLRIQGACRAGCSKEEIIEVVIQSVVYVGFTKALIALHLVKEVCEESGFGHQHRKDLPNTNGYGFRPLRRKNDHRHRIARRKNSGGAGA